MTEPTDAKLLPATVFCTPRIKAALQQDTPQQGILTKPIVELLGTCSALFLQDLISGASTNTEPVSLADVQNAIQKDESMASLLEGVLDELEEGMVIARSKPQKKRKRLPVSATEALKLAASQQATSVQSETVVPDEDDYD